MSHGFLPGNIQNVQQSGLLGYDPMNKNSGSNVQFLLREIFAHLTDDQIALLHESTDSECMSVGNIYDIDTWKYQYENNAAFKNLLHQQDAIVREECEEMDLTQSCFDDCLYYNNVFSWLGAALNQSEIPEVMYMIQLYSVSAGPFSYYDSGNPDMCTFNYGTYCYTPAIAETFPITQHACCLPGSCVGDDAIRVLQSNTWCYEIYDGIYNNISLGPELGTVQVLNICEPIPREFDKFGPMFVVLIFVLFAFLVIVATCTKQYIIEDRQVNAAEVNNQSVFIASFNLQDIWKSFISVRPEGKRQYNFLDGIRVWSMSWVIFGHSFLYFLTAGASNLPTMFPTDDGRTDYKYVLQEFYMMFAEYAFYSVDSFFFLSGFLATFSIYRSLQKYPGRQAINLCHFWIPLAYLARLLRIAPIMIYTTAIQWQIADQLPGGYHVTSRNDYTAYCDDSWYKVFFFYANLELDGSHPEALNCMGHLWYIQCDMQMYILLPCILLLFSVERTVGIIASIFPVLVCVIIRLVYAFYYDFTANTLYPPYPTKNGGQQDQQSYYKPWTRMAPYFIGVAAMLIIIEIDEKMKRRGKKFILSKAMYFACITFSCFIMAALVFWPYQDVVNAPEERWSLLANQMYYALSKPAWGFALALFTFSLKYKSTEKAQKSIIKSFLSLEIYQSLGKLTYLMYLLHLIIFSWWALDLELPLYYDEWNEILLVIGVWFITLFASIILWFFMEKPISNLITVFLKTISGGNKKRENKIHDANDMNGIVEEVDKNNKHSFQLIDDSIDGANTDKHMDYNLLTENEETIKDNSFVESYTERDEMH